MACTHVIQFEDRVSCTAISPDGQLLAVGLSGGDVQLLDSRSGKRRTHLVDSSSLFSHSVAFSLASAPQQQLLAADSGVVVVVWDCNSGARVAKLKADLTAANSVAFSPDGRRLASVSRSMMTANDSVLLWRTDNWHAPPVELSLPWSQHRNYLHGVSFSCDSHLLVSRTYSEVKLWHILDAAADAPVAAAAAAATTTARPVLKALFVCCMVFSPVDSRLLAYGDSSEFLALARVNARRGDGALMAERKLKGHTDYILKLTFSPCGRKLVSDSNDKTVRLWSVASGVCLRLLWRHTDRMTAVAFYPNGTQLALRPEDNTIQFWTLCAWGDKTHRLFDAALKAAVFTLMCVRARLEEQGQGLHARLPRLPMEVWLLVFEQLHLTLGVC